MEAHPCARDVDATGDFELVPTERDRADRDARSERLLRDALTAVGHDARRSGEDRPVCNEALHVSVGGRVELARVERGRCGDNSDVLVSERFEQLSR